MGSDGSFVKHNGSVGGAGKIFLPSGEGGGCIESGPFKVHFPTPTGSRWQKATD
jgi:hypothetical protein